MLNLSVTPDNRPGYHDKPPSGFDAFVAIGGDIESFLKEDSRISGQSRPVDLDLIGFHEMVEAYFRTHTNLQYKASHGLAIRAEQILRDERPELDDFAFGAGPYRRYQEPFSP